MKKHYFAARCSSPVGELTLASDGAALTGLWLAGQKYYGAGAVLEEKDGFAVFDETKSWLAAYFAGKKPSPRELPLAPEGGEFRRLIWGLLLEIPYGEVVTYGELAERSAAKMGKGSMSAQAVGGAVGHNPISIIIPCHRVIGADGSLTGYAGGVEKKMLLLRNEGALRDDMFLPRKGTAL